MKNEENKAYLWGQRVARGYKRAIKTIKAGDLHCTNLAARHNLPRLLGHIPLILLLLLVITLGLILGGIIAFCLFTMAALISNDEKKADEDWDYYSTSSSSDTSEYRDGDQGFGLYSGSEDSIAPCRIDYDDDEPF